jgi:hypothetical protein
MTITAPRSHLIFMIVALALFTAIPNAARANTICYPDGCATFNFDLVSVTPGPVTSPESFSTLAAMMNVLYTSAAAAMDSVTPFYDAYGRIINVACGNGHTHAAYYCPPGETVVDGVCTAHPTCSITFDKNPIDRGESTTIHWSSQNATRFYIKGIGYVSTYGSTTVSPQQNTNYTGYVSDDYTNTASCPASLSVSGQTQCPEGYVLERGVCVAEDNNTAQCPIGYIRQNGVCIFSACPEGYKLQGTQCVVAGGECTAAPYCQGTSLVDGCTGDVLQICEWGCFSGSCNPIPAPNATLKAAGLRL